MTATKLPVGRMSLLGAPSEDCPASAKTPKELGEFIIAQRDEYQEVDVTDDDLNRYTT